MWFLYALISGLTSAGRRVFDKRLTGEFGNYGMGLIVNAFALPLMAVFLFILPVPTDIWHLSWNFWWPLLVILIVIYPIQTHLFFRAIREGEISSVMPVTALLPVFTLIISSVLIKEIPSVAGCVGIGLIVLGTYMLLKKKGVHMRAKPELYMIAATACIALGNTLDKIAIKASTPMFYSFVNTIGATVVFFILMHLYRQTHEFKKMHTMRGPLFLVGCLSAATFTAIMFAFARGPVSYVVAVRSINFILPAIWGLVFLHEKFTKRKLFSLICFSAGVVFLAFA